MLTRVSFDTFKNLRRVDVDLGRFTVLVGPNGGGKTSVLQGLHAVANTVGLSHPDTSSQFPLARDFVHDHVPPSRFGTDASDGYQLTVSDGGEAFTLVGGKSLQTIHFPGRPAARLNDPAVLGMAASGHPSLPWTAVLLLLLDPTRIVQPSVVEEDQPRLAATGEGLASVLSYLAGAHPERKEAIEADLAGIVPWFRRVRITPARVSRLVTRPFPVGHEAVRVPVEEEVWGHQFSVVTTDGAVVPADLVSEGTVLALALLTALHAPEAPGLLLLDDLDRGLHLGAQVRLVRTLRRLQEARPDLQIVATTHSPFLLQEVAAEDVRVLGLTPEGVRCRRLTDHPDFERWKSVLGTGEIWANLGEDWVGGER